ncbi:NAD(P)/FAD-dependent oxidoreductase [Pseudolysinimonas sp.]|uniref:flavin-containing monooxygenase n=1 Tax=Pseudolysinimonas sp. TaxID=2680009 RepID=UPI00286CF38F|nr:NAD(P)/FAD-dependent oxidoreductase [Pseudolysinimonas sp.]
MSALPDRVSAVVIGAGPAGLAAAAELKRVGVETIVLDKADRVGASWAGHYDRLHLHTSRGLSGLPGYRIPRRYGRWVARDDLLAYFAEYADLHDLDVRLGVAALAVERGADEWRVSWRRGDEHGAIAADTVVVATGYNHTAKLPDWPGLQSFTGKVVHSSEYKNPGLLGAREALVIGPGNSGAEIAADLADAGVRVALAMRTPPNVVLRAVAGIPGQALVIGMAPLPVKAQDALAGLLQRIAVGDLRKYGIPKAPRGIATQLLRDDVTPTIDVGLIRALKSGAVTVVAAVERFTKDSVVHADGTELRPDAVVVATGFQRRLEELVGDLGVLAGSGRPLVNADAQLAAHPGLFFLGYSNPLTGNLRQVGLDATKIAKAVAKGVAAG